MTKNPFDFVSSINDHKKIPVDKNYDQFLINRQLSYFIDTILHVNEANQFRKVPNELHYSFLFNSVKPRKRFSKWSKAKQEENIKKVSEFFDYSYSKAVQAMKVLTKEQLKEIDAWYEFQKEIE